MHKAKVSNSSTIPSGIPYSNINPSYTLTREFEIPKNIVHPSNYIEMQIAEMKSIVDSRVLKDFKDYFNYFKSDKAKDQRVTLKNGVNVPHVTNIITPDTPPIPYIEEYAEQGNVIDTVVKGYMTEGSLILPDNLPKTPHVKESIPELIGKFAWLPKEDIVFNEVDVKCYNKAYNYIGELDVLGTFKSTSAIMDIKRSLKPSKAMVEKYFKQMAAYVKCLKEQPDIMVILTPNGPIVSGEINKHFNLFLMDRGAYRERFNL